MNYKYISALGPGSHTETSNYSNSGDQGLRFLLALCTPFPPSSSPDKSNLREEEFVWFIIQGIMPGKSRRQELEAASRIVSTTRKRRAQFKSNFLNCKVKQGVKPYNCQGNNFFGIFGLFLFLCVGLVFLD